MVIRVPDQRPTQGGYTALDDRMLVLDFQAGNPQAFVEVHHRYSALARHVCQRFLPNRQDADEAFQETMIRVYQGLYKFNGGYALAPWIARIAKNVSLDHVRGTNRRPQADGSAPADDELPRPGDQADEIVERLVQRDLVLAVLADLPETHRRVLMLREIDGLSHREVAHELDLTTSQAKALIHRAKGSFRRRWLEKLADRGGLMALAFLPLVWLAKFESMIRRVGERAGAAAQTASAAAPDAVAQTMTATATAAPAATGLSERLVAAGVTILVAGSVTVGAAKIVNERAEPAPDEVTAAPAVIVQKTTAPGLEVPAVAKPEAILERPKQDQAGGVPESGETDPAVTTDPSEVVDPAPVEETPPPDAAPSPEPSPPPDPSPDPPPEPPPPAHAPAWSYLFTSSTSSAETCGCPNPVVVGSQVDRTGDGFIFSSAIRGGARDAGGELTWPFTLQQSGEVNGSGGGLEFRFTLDSKGGVFLYGGSATLAERSELPDGAVMYRFEGLFGRMKGAQSEPGLPERGSVTATLSVWRDGTIYAGSFALLDAPA